MNLEAYIKELRSQSEVYSSLVEDKSVSPDEYVWYKKLAYVYSNIAYMLENHVMPKIEYNKKEILSLEEWAIIRKKAIDIDDLLERAVSAAYAKGLSDAGNPQIRK